MLRTIAVALAVLAAVLSVGSLAEPARAETRAVTFPTALKPNTLNNVAVSRTAPVAFIGSRDTDTVFAFDPRTGGAIGQVEVADGPLFIEILEQPGKRTLAISCDGFLGAASNVVALVDATDPSAMHLERTIALPERHIFFLGYRTIRFVDDGAVLLATASFEETGAALLLAYDVATGAERSRVPVGFAPGSLDVAFDGTRRLAALTQSVAPRGRVTVVDATDPAHLQLVRTIKFPRKSGLYNVNNVELSEDGSYGVVATGDGNVFFAFEPVSGRVLSRTVTGAFPTYSKLFSADGAPRLLVTGENASAVFVYGMEDPASPSLIGVYDAPSVFIDVEPAVTSDGATAFAGTTDGNRIYAVDLSNGALRYQVATGERPVSTAVWEGNGERFVCSAAANTADVTTFRDTNGGFVGNRFTGPDGAALFSLYQNIVLDRSGATAFVASKRTNELLSINVATATVRDRITVGPSPSQIAISEDGNGRRTVLALCFGDATLAAVDASDPSDLRLDRQTPVETPYPFFLEFANVVVTGDGRTAFVADGNQFVYAVDVATGATIGSVGTGFSPITIALYEDRGVRRLAVLNAAFESTSVAVLDASTPSAMRIVSSADLPRDFVVALNNVPRFSVDGRFVYVGASLSEVVTCIRADSGAVSGMVEKSSAVVLAPFADGTTQLFTAANLGTDTTRSYRLRKSGAPREASALAELANSFLLVGNDPTVARDGAYGFVPNYGRSSLVSFNPATGSVLGELPLGKGPGQVVVDPATGAVVAIEVNGSASRILIGNLADLGPVRERAPAARAVEPAVPTATRPGRPATGALTCSDVSRDDRDRPRVASYLLTDGRLQEWQVHSKSKSR